jgi:hypothetical protein
MMQVAGAMVFGVITVINLTIFVVLMTGLFRRTRSHH